MKEVTGNKPHIHTYIYEVTATLTRRKPTQLSETDLCLFWGEYCEKWHIYTLCTVPVHINDYL